MISGPDTKGLGALVNIVVCAVGLKLTDESMYTRSKTDS